MCIYAVTCILGDPKAARFQVLRRKVLYLGLQRPRINICVKSVISPGLTGKKPVGQSLTALSPPNSQVSGGGSKCPRTCHFHSFGVVAREQKHIMEASRAGR